MTNVMKYLSLALAWLAPVQGFIVLILLFMGADTILGRRAARLKARKEGKDERLEVTSKKTRLGFLSKAFLYVGIMIATLFLDQIMLNDLIQYFVPNFPVHFIIAKGLGLILMFIEFDSIDEKIYKITGRGVKDLIVEKIRAAKKVILGAKRFKDSFDDDK